MKQKFMYNEKEIEENRKIIAVMIKEHYNEMVAFSATVSEMTGACSAKDYVRYAKSMSFDETVGVYSTAVMNPEAMLEYLDILDNTQTYEEFVESIIGDVMMDVYRKNLKLLE